MITCLNLTQQLVLEKYLLARSLSYADYIQFYNQNCDKYTKGPVFELETEQDKINEYFSSYTPVEIMKMCDHKYFDYKDQYIYLDEFENRINTFRAFENPSSAFQTQDVIRDVISKFNSVLNSTEKLKLFSLEYPRIYQEIESFFRKVLMIDIA